MDCGEIGWIEKWWKVLNTIFNPLKESPELQKPTEKKQHFLVGGWTNPSEKYDRQNSKWIHFPK